MTTLDIFLVVATICLVTLVAVLVSTLMQFNRNTRRIEALIDSLNQDLPPLLQSLADTSRGIQSLTEIIRDKAASTDKVIETAKGAADALLITTNMMKNSIIPTLTQIIGFSAGVQAFFRYLCKPDKHC